MIKRVGTGRQSGRHVSSANLNARYRQPLPRALTANASRMITRVRTGRQSDRHVPPPNQDACAVVTPAINLRRLSRASRPYAPTTAQCREQDSISRKQYIRLLALHVALVPF